MAQLHQVIIDQLANLRYLCFSDEFIYIKGDLMNSIVKYVCCSLAFLSFSSGAADFYVGVGAGLHQGRFDSHDFPSQSYLKGTTESPRPNDMQLDRQATGGVILMGLNFPKGYQLEVQLRNSHGFRYEGRPFLVSSIQSIDYKTKSLIFRGTAPIAEFDAFKVSVGLGLSFNKATENSMVESTSISEAISHKPSPPTLTEAVLRGYLAETYRQFGRSGRTSNRHVSPLVSLDFDYKLSSHHAIRLELDFKNVFGKKLSSPGRVDVYSVHLMYIHHFQ